MSAQVKPCLACDVERNGVTPFEALLAGSAFDGVKELRQAMCEQHRDGLRRAMLEGRRKLLGGLPGFDEELPS